MMILSNDFWILFMMYAKIKNEYNNFMIFVVRGVVWSSTGLRMVPAPWGQHRADH